MENPHTKSISTQVILALKEALANIYWRKQDCRQFIELTIKNNLIVSTIDWQTNVKYESVSQLIDRMVARKDMYFDDLLLLIQETQNINDFSHLKKWDDADSKIKKAKEAVEKLRSQTKGYFDIIEELKEAEKRRVENQRKISQTVAYRDKLDELKNIFYSLAGNIDNPQKRGIDFEKLLNDLFALFDLDPKRSFKITAEQIDGAFTFDNSDYLLEAKWQKQQTRAADLYVFGAKISGKLKNTLGLFISLEGFTSECLQATAPDLKSMVLMDGLDLMNVLDGRISFTDLIYLKRRHASMTGEIFYRVSIS